MSNNQNDISNIGTSNLMLQKCQRYIGCGWGFVYWIICDLLEYLCKLKHWSVRVGCAYTHYEGTIWFTAQIIFIFKEWNFMNFTFIYSYLLYFDWIHNNRVIILNSKKKKENSYTKCGTSFKN